jgi:uncharacterized protein (TIGR03437 family)
LAWTTGFPSGDPALDAYEENSLYISTAQIARAAAALASVPKWKTQYASEIQRWMQTVDDMVIQRFYSDKYGGSLPWLNQPIWDVRAGWFGSTAASLYQGTNQARYLDIAKPIATAFQAKLQPNKTGWIWDNGAIPIGSDKYPSAFGASDVGNQEGSPDTDNANAAVSMMVMMHEVGIAFTSADVQWTANTLTDVMWDGSTQAPIISNYIDGSNKTYRGQTNPGSNAFVGTGWGLLATYSQKVQDLLTNVTILSLTAPKTSATTNANSAWESRVALAGNLMRYKAPAPPVPLIISIVNGASFSPGISAGSLVTIKGSNLSNTTRSWNSSDFVNGGLPTQLDGVGVSINRRPAYISYISPVHINAQAPSDTAIGTVDVQVTNNGANSSSAAAQLQAASPAFFQWGKYAVATRPDYSLVGPVNLLQGVTTAPAKPADVIILWGTGFGPTDPFVPAGVVPPSDALANLSNPVTVVIGNLQTQVIGAAISPGSAGVYQIAVQVPNAAADGDQPVVAKVLGFSSPPNVLLSVQR